ncbi:MAG: helix-turn-helix transcriptional regulator [Deltaproteobacteria bacterium]|nr:helix-turn-helix transcriptional regulator [Deltaproteobacteria bacterium]
MYPGEKRKEFAARLGLAPETITRYLRGHQRISVDAARNIAKKTGASEVWILYGAELEGRSPPVEVVRREGSSNRAMSDEDRLSAAAGHVRDLAGVQREERESLAGMIEDLADPELRREIVLWYEFIKLKAKG